MAQISTFQSLLTSHTNALARESHEKSEIQSQIAGLTSHAESQRTQRDRLSQAIASTQRQIDSKLAAQRAYAEKESAQSRLNGPELQFWETYLGTTISGAGEDGLIRVTYAFPPARGEKEDREATFELHVPESGSGVYNVVYTKPKLPSDGMARVVNRLNETREIGVLLKGMRMLFQAELGERMTLR